MIKSKNRNFSFTLIEILVVATIISLLSAGAAISYSQIVKQSRDSKRKADIENVRAALEQYRSTNDVYPTTGTGSGLPFGTGSLTDAASNTYMNRIPQDPQSSAKNYFYSSSGTDYTIAAQLEASSTCSSYPPSGSCGIGLTCSYCVGPYGQK